MVQLKICLLRCCVSIICVRTSRRSSTPCRAGVATLSFHYTHCADMILPCRPVLCLFGRADGGVAKSNTTQRHSVERRRPNLSGCKFVCAERSIALSDGGEARLCGADENVCVRGNPPKNVIDARQMFVLRRRRRRPAENKCAASRS